MRQLSGCAHTVTRRPARLGDAKELERLRGVLRWFGGELRGKDAAQWPVDVQRTSRRDSGLPRGDKRHSAQETTHTAVTGCLSTGRRCLLQVCTTDCAGCRHSTYLRVRHSGCGSHLRANGCLRGIAENRQPHDQKACDQSGQKIHAVQYTPAMTLPCSCLSTARNAPWARVFSSLSGCQRNVGGRSGGEEIIKLLAISSSIRVRDADLVRYISTSASVVNMTVRRRSKRRITVSARWPIGADP